MLPSLNISSIARFCKLIYRSHIHTTHKKSLHLILCHSALLAHTQYLLYKEQYIHTCITRNAHTLTMHDFPSPYGT